MARTKKTPLQAHPDPKPSLVQVSREETPSNPTTANPDPKPSVPATLLPQMQKLEASPEQQDEMTASPNDLTCALCGEVFIGLMAPEDYRQHAIEGECTATGEIRSTSSGLSPPPESNYGDDLEDMPEPFVRGQMASYPATGADTDVDGNEAEDASNTIKLPVITDTELFAKSLENLEEMDYDLAYRRLENAQQALVGWQDEWLNHEIFIKKNRSEPVAQQDKTKELTHGIRNPRVLKPHQTGQGGQDIIEAFAFGYDHSTHPSKLGMQDPIGQRLGESSDLRQLRQRQPSRKVLDDYSSPSPEADENGNRYPRRARGEAAPATTVLIQEAPNEPPKRVFASGKRVGRPPKNSRIENLVLDNAVPSRYSTTPELSPTGPDTLVPGQKRKVHKRGPQRQRLPVSFVSDETEDEDSMSNSRSNSQAEEDSDEENDEIIRRVRKRVKTDDFDGRTQVCTNIQPESEEEEVDVNFSLKERVQKEKRAEEKGTAWKTRRANLKKAKEDNQAHDHGSATSSAPILPPPSIRFTKPKAKTVDADKSQSETPSNAATDKSKNSDSKPEKKASVKKEKPEKGITAASRNMIERWRKKKEAEAAGIAAPKIGRYPKGSKEAIAAGQGSNKSTPATTPAQASSVPLPLQSEDTASTQKRKREEEPTPEGEPVISAEKRPVESILPPSKKIKFISSNIPVVNKPQPTAEAVPMIAQVIPFGEPALNNNGPEIAGTNVRDDAPPPKQVKKSKGPQKKAAQGTPVITPVPTPVVSTAKKVGRPKGSTNAKPAPLISHDFIEENPGSTQSEPRKSNRAIRPTSRGLDMSRPTSSSSSQTFGQTTTSAPLEVKKSTRTKKPTKKAMGFDGACDSDEETPSKTIRRKPAQMAFISYDGAADADEIPETVGKVGRPKKLTPMASTGSPSSIKKPSAYDQWQIEMAEAQQNPDSARSKRGAALKARRSLNLENGYDSDQSSDSGLQIKEEFTQSAPPRRHSRIVSLKTNRRSQAMLDGDFTASPTPGPGPRDYDANEDPLNSKAERKRKQAAAARGRRSHNFTDNDLNSAPASQMVSNGSVPSNVGPEDLQRAVNQQLFASEYEYYQSISQGSESLGKRKRKSIQNLDEIMRMEAGSIDGDSA